jgi:hypothetical protein
MKHPHLTRQEPAAALAEEPVPEGGVRIPILATQVDALVVPLTEDEDVCSMMLSTLLTTTLVHLTRGQTISLGGELIKLGNSMKRRPEKKKIEVIGKGGLVLPG